MEFSQTPPNWLQVKLVEIATLNMGQSPPSSDVNDFGEGIAFFQGKADFGKLHPTARKFCTAPKKTAESGDILLSIRAPVGPTNVANQKTAIGRGLAAIRAEAKYVEPKFLIHYFRCIEPWMSQQGTGTTFKAVSGAFLKELDTVFPPLIEQKVIAKKLDTLLAQVENTKARLDSIPEILKRFRQSVLASAVSGRLTEEWRAVQMNSIESWQHTTFKDISREITVGFVGRMANRYQESGIPFLRSQNVRAFKYSNKNLLYISPEFHKEIYKSRLEPGDLAIVRSGAPGTTCVIPESIGTANCSDLVIARPSQDLIPEFGCIFMNSEVAQKNVFENQVGVAQQHFNVGSMKKMPIHLPPVKEQTEIARRVDQLFAHADRIEQQVNQALARVNNLTQSILAKAFRGELTEQWRKDNPALISGENSAEALLAKIKVERETIKRQPKPKRTSVKKETDNNMSKQIIKVAEALKREGTALSGQQLLAAAGYPSDSSTEELEKFFLDIREALSHDKSIVKLERGDNEQDWFALAESATNE
ncbi:restriction endonuclease subunit S [Vreelandella titanicae]|uniref:Restriction endonuclease subunit S n=1 Tax=Vreelandella titanicae TaxID=664683 RepID=A0A558JFH2_9GAMM|nr:restriction endonuclease subunit S [Halomonas titanicae]TVU92377.1 restriction endonuclease subunit S [Halomonas titanicae]